MLEIKIFSKPKFYLFSTSIILEFNFWPIYKVQTYIKLLNDLKHKRYIKTF